MRRAGFVAVVAGLLLAPGSVALAKADTADQKDPNRAICRTVETTGSRLKAAKVCMTAQQWAEQRQADRQSVEKIQADRYKNAPPEPGL